MNKKAIEKLHKFADYNDNWNGYGAPPWKEEDNYIEEVEALLNSLSREVEIYPLPNHIVQIEYTIDNVYHEFELNKNHIASAYFDDEKSYVEFDCYWWEIIKYI